MNKAEFLAELRERMAAEGADALIPENLNYYDRYISEQCEKGKTEQEVLEELGNPALIARSILEAAGYEVDGIPDRREGSSRQEREVRFDTHMDAVHADRSGKIIFVLAFILILVLLILAGLFWILSPILVPVLLFACILRIFRGGGRRF